jgi:REP element-mobilizing transposase RayT
VEIYRLHERASVYFFTFSVVDWLPVFVTEPACLLVTDSFAYCHSNKGLRVNAYVIMPTHLHAILFDHEHNNDRLAQAVTEFRKYTGRALSDYAAEHLPSAFTRTFRDAAASDRTRRFWQPSRHPVALTTQPMWR